jgi:hypothetical protein
MSSIPANSAKIDDKYYVQVLMKAYGGIQKHLMIEF